MSYTNRWFVWISDSPHGNIVLQHFFFNQTHHITGSVDCFQDILTITGTLFFNIHPVNTLISYLQICGGHINYDNDSSTWTSHGLRSQLSASDRVIGASSFPGHVFPGLEEERMVKIRRRRNTTG